MHGNQMQILRSLHLQIIGLEEVLPGIQTQTQAATLEVEVLEVAEMVEIHHLKGDLEVDLQRQVLVVMVLLVQLQAPQFIMAEEVVEGLPVMPLLLVQVVLVAVVQVVKVLLEPMVLPIQVEEVVEVVLNPIIM
jgi:hypothetical protein